MKKKEVPKDVSTDEAKPLTKQLSDLRLENRALKRLFNSQQAQINELNVTVGLLWNKIGM